MGVGTARSSPGWRAIPSGVWALGFVSLFMDVSSEMIHALLPVYLVTVMGTSALTVGFIEGIAEATAAITKVFSGALSDWLGKRKFLAATGYGLAALTKPVFPLANTVDMLVAARFIDRFGKGIRGAPRDALVADLSPPEIRGASYGLRQSLDTVGAFTGPLLAILFMWLLADNFRDVFWIAALPAFISFALIAFVVREPPHVRRDRKARMPLRRGELSRLGPIYWIIVAIAALFTLARFSEAFLVLRAQSIGLSLMLVPAVMVVMNIAYAISAYPAGVISDRAGRMGVLIAGLALLMVADWIIAMTNNVALLGIGVLLWGLHMGFTQGVFSALVADAAPENLRGTAFGMFNLVTGVALLLASIIAGELWDRFGPQGTFLAGAGFAGMTLIAVLSVRSWLKRKGSR
jgi:MFS family permease